MHHSSSYHGNKPRYQLPLKDILAIFLPFASCYIFTSLFKSINAVQGPILVESMHLSAGNLGLLSACFLLGYSVFQLPLGIWLDTFNPKHVQIVLLLLASFGIVIFASAHSVLPLAISRLLIGMGLAGGLTAALKINAEIFPSKYLGIYNSMVFLIGSIGALFATEPAQGFFVHFGWRHVNWGLAWMVLLLSMIMWFIVPHHRTKNVHPHPESEPSPGGMMYVLKNRFFWHVTPLIATSFGFFVALQGLWAGLWMRHISGFTAYETAHSLEFFAIAVILGFLATIIVAYISEHWEISLSKMMVAGVILNILFAILMVDALHVEHRILWCCYGFSAQFVTLAFTIVSNYFSAEYAGRAVTAVTFVTFLVGFMIQHLIGTIVSFWKPDMQHAYPLDAYRVAFGVFVLLQIAALFWMLYQRKRYQYD